MYMLIVDESKASSLPLLKLRTGPLPSDFVNKKIAFLQTYLGVSGKIFFVSLKMKMIIDVAEKLLNISWNLTGCITGVFPPPSPLYLPLFHARSHARR